MAEAVEAPFSLLFPHFPVGHPEKMVSVLVAKGFLKNLPQRSNSVFMFIQIIENRRDGIDLIPVPILPAD
jgi:hypothetical protein